MFICALVVFAGAMGYGFSQDDFAGLGRATGVLPPLVTPWRWLSHQGFFDLWHRLFALDARPWHAASLVVHAACAVLVRVLLRRHVGAPAATLGAVAFAVHPIAYTAVYWVSAIGDSLALAFGLVCFLCAARPDAWRWLAVPALALSYLAKESTLLLPFFVALAAWLPPPEPDRADAPRRSPARDPLHVVLVVIAVAYAAWLLGFGGAGVPAELDSTRPYAVGLGAHLGLNLLTYAGWSAIVPLPFVTSHMDAIDPSVFGTGGALIAAWIAGCASPPLRRRGWVLAGAWIGLMLLPVLPLRNHTYHYYAYAALPGIAWLIAAAFDTLATLRPRVARRRTPAVVAGLLALALAVNGRAVVERIETAPLGNGPLRADPTVDRALVVERIRAGLRRAALPAGTRLRFWSPARLAAGLPPETPDSYWERNVRAATCEGMAIRVLFPAVREVEFVPLLARADPDVRYAVFGIDGRTDVFTWSALDSILSPDAILARQP